MTSENNVEKLFMKSLKGINIILSGDTVTVKKLNLNFNKSKFRKFKSRADAVRFFDGMVIKLLKKGYVENSIQKNPKDTGITSADVLKLIDELGLPPIVKKIFLNESIPQVVDKFCSFRSPYPFFDLTKKEQQPYGDGLIYPVFCGPDFYRITGYDIKKKKYVIFDIEDTVNRDTIKFYSWNQILAIEFSKIIENEFTRPTLNDISELSDIFDFKYGTEIFNEFELKNFSDYDEIVKWQAGLVRKFSGK
ncbi:MAG: hypothetical protein JW982_14725 [Spirochaetes bacterium]|nr:hypothetical protein [Spirochaetota bacterium]